MFVVVVQLSHFLSKNTIAPLKFYVLMYLVTSV